MPSSAQWSSALPRERLREARRVIAILVIGALQRADHGARVVVGAEVADGAGAGVEQEVFEGRAFVRVLIGFLRDEDLGLVAVGVGETAEFGTKLVVLRLFGAMVEKDIEADGFGVFGRDRLNQAGDFVAVYRIAIARSRTEMIDEILIDGNDHDIGILRLGRRSHRDDPVALSAIEDRIVDGERDEIRDRNGDREERNGRADRAAADPFRKRRKRVHFGHPCDLGVEVLPPNIPNNPFWFACSSELTRVPQ